MFIPTVYLIVLVFEGRALGPIPFETSSKTITKFSHNFWIFSRFALASIVFLVRFCKVLNMGFLRGSFGVQLKKFEVF